MAYKLYRFYSFFMHSFSFCSVFGEEKFNFKIITDPADLMKFVQHLRESNQKVSIARLGATGSRACVRSWAVRISTPCSRGCSLPPLQSIPLQFHPAPVKSLHANSNLKFLCMPFSSESLRQHRFHLVFWRNYAPFGFAFGQTPSPSQRFLKCRLGWQFC